MFKYLKYLSLLPILISMIGHMEELFKGIKEGEVKKNAVMAALSNLFSMLSSAGVLGKEDIDKIFPNMPKLVDLIVDFLNSFGVFKHGS
ncbi:MAG TPA: hypothetical protein VI935_01180 [Thermodesulfobacteriota bacterium]|nr:hypothetical protein [Thermodesulfobacteriota bacterium]